MKRARKVAILATVAAVVVVIGVGWWQFNQFQAQSAGDAEARGADSGLTRYPGGKGIPVPAIEGTTIAGSTLSLNDLRGHVVVLNVWGSWCGPCRDEAPDLAAISMETAPRGVRFVGIDVRDNPAAARAFERRFGITYPSFDDRHGLVLAQFTGIIPVSAVPSTLVVDPGGTIRARVVGRIDPDTLRGLIVDAERQT